MRQEEGRCIRFRNLGVALQEAVGRRLLDFKLQIKKDVLLHLQDLSSSVCIIGKVNEVFHSWRIYLFIFGCDEEGSNTHELNVGLLDIEHGEIPVNQVNCEVECFGQQFKF